MMAISARDYAGRVRDPKWERALARELRACTELERLDFLTDFMTGNPSVALILARTCLSENQSFESLLDRCLREADASGMRYWLECVVPRLGFRRVIARLRGQVESNWQGVEKALYWLPLFAQLPGYSKSELESLRPA